MNKVRRLRRLVQQKWLTLWNSLWDLKIPGKMKIFLCRCVMQALPLHHHKLLSEEGHLYYGRCPRCFSVVEDGLHWWWAWSCPIAMSRWAPMDFHVGPIGYRGAFSTKDHSIIFY